ncbi:MAG: beta-N-acetylhexosaminidase [Bacteroidales bacterium]|nr:beta-N-acetylhexosaminidase [Bacteroidales bacterium]
MVRKFLLFTLLCIFINCKAQQNINEYSIIPYPNNISLKDGSYVLKENPSIAFRKELSSEANLLKEYLTTDFSLKPQLKEGNKKETISLILDSSVLPGKTEGYILDVNKDGIQIKANSRTGIFYGIQSLRQLISTDNGKWIIRYGTISDYPNYAWRGFMLDEGRYFKGKEVVLKLLDDMASMKMNRFHWHLTNDQGWRIEIKKYPKLTEIGAYRDSSEINHFGSNIYDGKPHGGFYTQDEIKEVVAYAKARHITIIPEISMPGHASAAIASYPWLGTTGKQIKVPGQFGVHYNTFNVADERVMTFFEDVIDEVIDLFPGDVFHIGGDEVKYDEWKASPTVQAYMQKHGLNTPAELQVYFTNNISNLLDSKNRRMMGWNEILGQQLHEYQSAEDTRMEQQLNKKAIVHFWKGNQQQMKEAIDKGYDMVNSYHVFTYIDYSYQSIPLSKSYSFNPKPEGIRPEQEKQVLGLGCQMWGEFIPTVESMNKRVYPRIAAYSEVGWTLPENKNYDRFKNSLSYFLNKWEKEGIIYGETD